MKCTRSIEIEWVLVCLFLTVISGCFPQLGSLEAPTVRLILEGSGLVEVDPPVVGKGEAVFLINLEATNPNPVALTFMDVSFDLIINHRQVGQGQAAEEVRLSPMGTERFAVTVAVSLEQVPELLSDIEKIIVGEPVHYRVEGSATGEAVGFRRRFTSVVLAEGIIVQPFPL